MTTATDATAKAKAKAIVEASAIQTGLKSDDANPTKNFHSSKPNREEGELSSSDCDGNEVFAMAMSPAPNHVIPPAVTQPERPVSGNNLASTTYIQTHVSAKPMKQTSVEKIPVGKSVNSGWHARSGGRDNLVIRFSDDDSGSDSEEHRQEQPRETKSNSLEVDESQKPSALSAVRLKIPGQNDIKASKVMPKKGPLNHTFVSSVAKVKGAANYRSTKPSPFDHVSRTSYFNIHNKNSTTKGFGHDQGPVLSHTKLQDLREQIALRETELKLKAARKNREQVLKPSKNANVLQPKNDVRARVAVTNTASIESEEPAKKRLKSISNEYQNSSDGKPGMPPVKSNLVSKDSELEIYNLQRREMSGQTQRLIPNSKNELASATQKRANDIPGTVSPGDIPDDSLQAPGRRVNCTQPKKASWQVDPCVSAKENTPLENTTNIALMKDMETLRSKHQTGNGLLSQQRSLTSKGRRELDVPGTYGQDVRSGSGRIVPLSNKHQVRNKVNLQTCVGNASLSSVDNMDMHSLSEMEDKIDKELEEAQEQRRLCEIEERNAFKAYRKAQRALFEANARCADLYRQREQCSAHFRSFLLGDSSLLFSSANHANTSGVNASDTSSLRHRSQPVSGDVRVEDDPNVQCVDADPHHMSYEQYDRLNLGTEQISEPDLSTSEQLHHYSTSGANGVISPQSDPIMSEDVDEGTSEMDDDDSVQPSIHEHQTKQKLVLDQNKVDIGKACDTDHEDPLLLEAALRSELFTRLGPRMFSRTVGSGCNLYPAVEKDRENGFGSEKNESFSKAESEGQCHVEKDRENCLVALNSLICSPLTLRSTFTSSREMLTKSFSDNMHKEDEAHIFSDETRWGNQITNPVGETLQLLYSNGNASYTEDHSVDPFWPLCMFELRGKCNNDCCRFQHIRDFSQGKVVLQHQHEDTDTHGHHVEASLDLQKCSSATSPSKREILISPTYLVDFQILKADPRSKISVAEQKVAKCWLKCFSFYLAVSIVPQNDVIGNEPLFDGNDGRIELLGSWRDSSYFQRTGTTKKINQAACTNDQTLEMAILLLNHEPDKQTGSKKALCILSRALEVDPSSESLWIVYLLLCYSRAQFIGDHDMFLHAVKHNEQSYGLWLLYINSRKHLDDRLAAYEYALTVICHHSAISGKDNDKALSSGCILDLFLQMIDCLCLSGNFEKALHKIYALLPATANSDEPSPKMLSDILSCLTVSDTCIFWVSCVYLIIYRKLPAAIVQQFECVKELLPVDWSSVHLPDNERLRAVKLVEMAANSVESDCSSGLPKSAHDRKSAQQFALSHIRCMMALGDMEGWLNLLEKYVKLHPTCVELVVVSAQLLEDGHGNSDLIGFEDAIQSWPKGTSGIQCVWNQYAVCALQKGRTDFVKDLMAQWYDSLWKVQCYQNENSNIWECGNSSRLLDYGTSRKEEVPRRLDQIDLMFGLLNLALHKVLQNDPAGGHKAIDDALRASVPDYLWNCMREHAMFLLFQSKDATITWQLSQLKAYLDVVHSFPRAQPLSTLFISGIKKPRVQQVVTGLLSPVTSNASQLNVALEVWNGPTLLPPKLTNSKDFVDFVEAVLEMVPSNYELALSACKLLQSGYNFSDVSSTSLLFWSSSILVDAIFRAIPVPPEYLWVEAAEVLSRSTNIESILERFFRKALSAHPFSRRLWLQYQTLHQAKGDQAIIDAARRRGISLDPT